MYASSTTRGDLCAAIYFYSQFESKIEKSLGSSLGGSEESCKLCFEYSGKGSMAQGKYKCIALAGYRMLMQTLRTIRTEGRGSDTLLKCWGTHLFHHPGKKKKTVSPPSPEAEFIALATAVAKTTIERNVNGKETSSYNL